MSIAKIVILAVAAVLVLVVVLVAVAAFSVFNGVTGEAEPLTAAVIADGQAVEGKIESALTETSAFYLELTNEELSALLLYRVGSVSPIRDISVEINPGLLEISGGLGNAPPIPFSVEVFVKFVDGRVELEARNMSVSFLPVPGVVKDELQPLIDQGLDINEVLSDTGGVQIQRFDLQPGRITIVGVQRGGSSVSALTTSSLLDAVQAAGTQAIPVPPGANSVPPGSAGLVENGDNIYLALGDSLAANVGVARPQQGYVSRFHAYLEKETGQDLGLINLGVSGESSISFKQGQMLQALEEIRSRNSDGDPATRVSVVTLDLGANDLLTHLGSAECQLEPRGDACQTRISAGLEGFGNAFPEMLATLRGELDSEAELYIMTMYNPFDFGLGIPFEDFSNGIIAQLNEIITSSASQAGAKVADPFSGMAGNANAWTNMLQGDIHPNADGYQVLALSLVEAK